MSQGPWDWETNGMFKVMNINLEDVMRRLSDADGFILPEYLPVVAHFYYRGDTQEAEVSDSAPKESRELEQFSSLSTIKRHIRSVAAAQQLHLAYKNLSTKSIEIGDVLGEGSYGSVYAATVKEDGQRCALKVLYKQYIMRNNASASVMAERDVLVRCGGHPFIVSLLGCFQDSDSLYFAMECADIGDIAHAVQEFGPLDVESARWIAAQTLSALRCLHENRILDRDLKPENILLVADGTVRLTDFGTAKLNANVEWVAPTPEDIARWEEEDRAAAQAEREAIEEGRIPPKVRPRGDSFVGTAAYVPPELLQYRRVCGASDLWALGCVIYFMLTGKSPFLGSCEMDCFELIRAGEYDLSESARIPLAAHSVIKQLLQQDPALRDPPDSRIETLEFFQGINWDLLQEIPPPPGIVTLVSKLKHQREAKQRRGVDGRQLAPPKSQIGILGDEAERMSPLLMHSGDYHEQFVHVSAVSQERILRRPLMRILCLTDFPRLFFVESGIVPTHEGPDEDALVTPYCVDQNSNPVEITEIALCPQVSVEVLGPNVFKLHTRTDVYKLTAEVGGANLWKSVIDSAKNKPHHQITVPL